MTFGKLHLSFEDNANKNIPVKTEDVSESISQEELHYMVSAYNLTDPSKLKKVNGTFYYDNKPVKELSQEIDLDTLYQKDDEYWKN